MRDCIVFVIFIYSTAFVFVVYVYAVVSVVISLWRELELSLYFY